MKIILRLMSFLKKHWAMWLLAFVCLSAQYRLQPGDS